jgi:hypothetical protein
MNKLLNHTQGRIILSLSRTGQENEVIMIAIFKKKIVTRSYFTSIYNR